MGQMLHLFYTTIFLRSAAADAPVDLTIPVPVFREFHEHLWSGKSSLADNYTKQQYALVHLQQLRHNLRLPRLENALRIVTDGHSLIA